MKMFFDVYVTMKIYYRSNSLQVHRSQVIKWILSPDIIHRRIDERFKDQLPQLIKILTI